MKPLLMKVGVALSIVLVAASAACGGDDGDDGSSQENTPAAQATSAATTAAKPTEAEGSGDQPQFNEMTESQQAFTAELCDWAAGAVEVPVPYDNDLNLVSAQAGELGMDIADAAAAVADANDDAELQAAAQGMLTVCEDIGWAPS